jgi:hypothetical protein
LPSFTLDYENIKQKSEKRSFFITGKQDFCLKSSRINEVLRCRDDHAQKADASTTEGKVYAQKG